MTVCHCHRVSSATVQAAISAGAKTVSEVTESSQAGGGCGSCSATIEALLATFADRPLASKEAA